MECLALEGGELSFVEFLFESLVLIFVWLESKEDRSQCARKMRCSLSEMLNMTFGKEHGKYHQQQFCPLQIRSLMLIFLYILFFDVLIFTF